MNAPAQTGAHTSVLLAEAVDALVPAAAGTLAAGTFVDGTFGRGGHARAILARLGPSARPAMNRRGPGSSQLSVASLRPQSAPPVSRTLVKPRSSNFFIKSAARAVISVSGTLHVPSAAIVG